MKKKFTTLLLVTINIFSLPLEQNSTDYRHILEIASKKL